MTGHRTERIGHLIREKIGALILEGQIKDPRVNSLLSINHVKVSRDLSYADVYVSSVNPEGSVAKGVAGLESAAGFIQSVLARILYIRQIPHLRFHEDTTIKEGFDLVKKIEDLAKDEGN
ncbi:MAG: 30S ribosome-binding factor RbfA [Treponema sp.]|jgi:ribosome-binding factor A|nr:30S ribosome-binding factor RbfA [Treponema sp.]